MTWFRRALVALGLAPRVRCADCGHNRSADLFAVSLERGEHAGAVSYLCADADACHRRRQPSCADCGTSRPSDYLMPFVKNGRRFFLCASESDCRRRSRELVRR